MKEIFSTTELIRSFNNDEMLLYFEVVNIPSLKSDLTTLVA